MKTLILIFIFSIFSTAIFAQSNNHQLSSHILDISKGSPAVGVSIKLEKYNDKSKSWNFVEEKITDSNGRISDFLPSDKSNLGIYKLTYFTSPYFKSNNTESFYPFIEVVFQIKDKNHYHVPITLSAYGYSTYRGN
ncbi:hydroxyisourate hydrolase [Chryseobacterium balustinum]|uniref:5-hydroxyisourate hydrolase n=1 Tax=Chryseobacterium balustinum TaxID=246 RepID=A0AAX2IS68_9FLAO|nr:hydroxyisourate hydrolase [Chryseobacterium balustinum]AZB28387.1 hydroxyisourate hydrolase [Chryseobacterium balustinum]SKC04463.1 5-hydroxyisourate hydrolase [Chryseobacterium balustinum]SQA92669.1 5-hydroxyisourate hydrolase precursor [Chryseobacterium balustinum]